MSTVPGDILYWAFPSVSLGATIGIAVRAITYLRNKIREDRMQEKADLEMRIDRQDENIRRYVNQIVTSAALRRDKQEFMLEQIQKRIEAVESQQSMQLQIIMQNQEAIRRLIDKQQGGGGESMMTLKDWEFVEKGGGTAVTENSNNNKKDNH